MVRRLLLFDKSKDGAEKCLNKITPLSGLVIFTLLYRNEVLEISAVKGCVGVIVTGLLAHTPQASDFRTETRLSIQISEISVERDRCYSVFSTSLLSRCASFVSGLFFSSSSAMLWNVPEDAAIIPSPLNPSKSRVVCTILN